MSNLTFLKNSGLTFLRNIVLIILGLLITVLIARILGPEKQGIYALIILLPNMLMTFLNLGISSATVYYIGKGKYKLDTIVSTNIALSILLSLFSTIIGSLIIWFFSDSIFNELPIVIAIIFLNVLPILFFNKFLQSIFQGLEDFKVYNIIAVSGKVVNFLLLLITIYFLNYDVLGALFSFACGNLSTTIIILYLIKKRACKFSIKEFSMLFVKDSLSYGFKAHLSNILAFVNYRADIIFISYFLNPLSVGIYNVAVNVAERLWIISGPVSTVLFPRISSSSGKYQDDLTALVSRNVLFLSVVTSLLFYLLSDLMIYLLFGKEYLNASIVIKILLPGITLFSAERILSNSLAGKGKPELNLYTSLFTVICNISLNIFMIPIYGVNGAALATSISYVLTFIIKLKIYSYVTKTSIFSLVFITKKDIVSYKKFIIKIISKK